MKPFIPYSLLAAFAACGLASAQTAVTTPVGYITLGDTTVGEPSVKAETDVFFSLPLQRPTEFTGDVDSVSALPAATLDITLESAPTLTSGVPYLLKVNNGSKEGQVLVVSGVAGAVVTVSAMPGDTLADIVAGSSVSLFKAWTPASLFSGDNAVPVGTRVFASAGVTPGVDLSLDVIYEFDGTNWVDGFTFDTVDDAILNHGETLMLRNIDTNPIDSLVLTGEVPVTNSRLVVSKLEDGGDGQDNFVTFSGAGTEDIGSSGLSAIVAVGDRVFGFDNNASGFDKSPATIAEWDGANWVDGFTFDIVDTTFNFNGANGYMIRLGGATDAGDFVWSNEPDYVPGLTPVP
jgi:uncharacterized protein (TIGR02597 family)